jgi:hypothetical protein
VTRKVGWDIDVYFSAEVSEVDWCDLLGVASCFKRVVRVGVGLVVIMHNGLC